MKNISQSFKLGLVALCIFTLSACSSSKKADDTTAPVETAAEANVDKPAEAATDAVPTPDSLAATPENIAEVPSADPAQVPLSDATVPGVDPALAAVTEVPKEPEPAKEPEPTFVPDAATAVKSEIPDPVADVSPVADAKPIEPTPVAEAPKEEPKVDDSGATKYTVKQGDTLMQIAFEQYGDLYRWREIYQANKPSIQDFNHVPPGTVLTLKGAGMVTIEKNGESYLIKRGDTLGLISNDVYGTIRKWKKLWENNRQMIKDPNKIYAGFYLYYVPETKRTLTHEEVQPALKKEDSAATQKRVAGTPRRPASGKKRSTKQ